MPATIQISHAQLERAAELGQDVVVYEQPASSETLEFIVYPPQPDNPMRRSVIIDTQGNLLSDQWHNGELT